MKVLLIAPQPPPYGGMALQAGQLAALLRGDGVDVDVFASNFELPRILAPLARVSGVRTVVRALLVWVELWRRITRSTVVHVFAASWLYFFVVVYPAVVVSRARGARVVINYRGGEAGAFFRRYYVPNNATLTLAGDFDPDAARALVEKYFGPIPSGPPVVRTLPPPVSLRAETRIALEAKVQQPQVFIDFPTARGLSKGDHEMDLLALVLAGGKASRLYRRLVYELQIAQSVSANQQSQLLQSVFEISASPLGGHTLDEVVKVIDEELEALRTKPVEEAELERVKNQLEFEQLRSLEPALGRAERLQAYNLQAGDPGYLARDLAMYRALDAAALRAAANQYLRKDGRVVVTVTPNPDAPIMGRIKAPSP